MKPIYKKPILEQLDELIQKAKDERKELEAIELTEQEFNRFLVEVESRCSVGLHNIIRSSLGAVYKLVVIRQEEKR
jgi:hypothetical protein